MNGADVTYSGEWQHGKRHGRGKLTTWSSAYNGEWRNGRRHGRGRQIYPSGNVYDGEWRYDLKHGNGIIRWVDRAEVLLTRLRQNHADPSLDL